MMEEEKKHGDENVAEPSTKPESSGKQTPKSLKAKSKIVKSAAKKVVKKVVKAKNAKDAPKDTGDVKKDNESVLEGKKEGGNIEEKTDKELNLGEENQQKDETKDELIEKSKQLLADQEKTGASDNRKHRKRNRGRNDTSKSKNSLPQSDEKRKEANDDAKSERDPKNEEKHGDKEKKSQNETKKERLGGLIFMCNAKTKPDCFHYRVMGVPVSKKDTVMAVKPGVKLFLYDYDLKLMYGIYKASASGGMKLEPKAFGGSFPAQVRFTVHTDCYPLPENVFKKAMKENYTDKNKFKTELTERQARKLMSLFRPAALYSTALPIQSPPAAAANDRKVYDRIREKPGRDRYANSGARNDPLLIHERDQRMAYQEVAPLRREEVAPLRREEVAPLRREEVPRRDLFLTEKEYRAYGLKGDRRKLTPPRHISSTRDPYPRDYDRDILPRHPDPLYREALRSDPPYLTEREYGTYDLGARHALQSPRAANVSSADPYLSSLRRESYLDDSDLLERRGPGPVDRLYSTYAADALSDYNQGHHYQMTKPDEGLPPVSSRYSFAGPSVSFR